MKKKSTICVIASLVLGTSAFAGAHSGWSGKGTQLVTESNVQQGKSGMLVHNVSTDIWDWANAPDGFPKAVTAKCDNYITFAEGNPIPVGGSGSCQFIDSDGDVGLFVGIFQPDGSANVDLVTGTGKLSNYVGASWNLKTDFQINETSQIYSFKPM